jgi:uncharacterized membrane protein
LQPAETEREAKSVFVAGGMMAGAAAGAAIGVVAGGPVGVVVGGTLGAVAGALGGEAAGTLVIQRIQAASNHLSMSGRRARLLEAHALRESMADEPVAGDVL